MSDPTGKPRIARISHGDGPAAAPPKPVRTPPPVNRPVPPTPDVVVRRTRRHPFIPPRPDGETPAVSRELLSRNTVSKPQLSRNRKIAGNLPEWDPLPPGEVTVRRGEPRTAK